MLRDLRKSLLGVIIGPRGGRGKQSFFRWWQPSEEGGQPSFGVTKEVGPAHGWECGSCPRSGLRTPAHARSQLAADREAPNYVSGANFLGLTLVFPPNPAGTVRILLQGGAGIYRRLLRLRQLQVKKTKNPRPKTNDRRVAFFNIL